MTAIATALDSLFLEQVSSYISVASATCVIYDHIITLDLEFELVWTLRKPSVVQGLFLLNRYLGLLFQLFMASVFVRHVSDNPKIIANQALNLINSGDFSIPSIILVFGAFVIIGAMQGITIFRVYSMRRHSTWIRRLLVIGFVIEMTVLFTIIGFCTRNAIRIVDPVSSLGIHMCTIIVFPAYYFASWPPFLGFEIMIFFLSVWIAMQHYRSVNYLVRGSQSSPPTTKLVYILFRDSITFPSICIVLCFTNLLCVVVISPNFGRALLPISTLAPCIIGPRLVLNLREAYYRPFTEECEVLPSRRPDLDCTTTQEAVELSLR